MDNTPTILPWLWLIVSGACVYLAWFQPQLLQQYLRWASRIYGGTQSGRKWMTSRYYFWIMRGVTIFLFLLCAILLIKLM
jgi:hypothetical protein